MRAVAARQRKLKATAQMSGLMHVLGGCAEPAHTALAYTITVTGERYKLGARPASTTAMDGNVASRDA